MQGTSRPPGPSVRLAMIALGLAVLVLGAGVVAELLTTSDQRVSPPPADRTVPHSSLVAVSGRGQLRPIITQGQPPVNIVNSVVVPKGARPGAAIDDTTAFGAYDQTLDFTVAASSQDVITFYKEALPVEHWHVDSEGPAHGQPTAYQVLAQQAGSDSNTWEIGVTIDNSVTPAASIGSATTSARSAESTPGTTTFPAHGDTTHFSVELYIRSDTS